MNTDTDNDTNGTNEVVKHGCDRHALLSALEVALDPTKGGWGVHRGYTPDAEIIKYFNNHTYPLSEEDRVDVLEGYSLTELAAAVIGWQYTARLWGIRDELIWYAAGISPPSSFDRFGVPDGLARDRILGEFDKDFLDVRADPEGLTPFQDCELEFILDTYSDKLIALIDT